MTEEIINRVTQSALVTFDLGDHYPRGERKVLDIKQWLYEGLILREKEFRTALADHDWSHYRDCYVALGCSTDAIVPGWAYMLIGSHLKPFVKQMVIGDLEQLETTLYFGILQELDVTPYQDRPVIIKGCNDKPVPPNAYLWATARLQTVAKSIMYGEACSSVPLFKRRK